MKKIFLLLSFIGIGIWGFAQTETTNAATSILFDGATLNGTVDTAGVNETDVEVYFYYKVASGPGNWEYEGGQSITGSGTQSYSATITGLKTHKEYKYQIVLYNNDNGDEHKGSLVNFTTNYKPTATDPTASSITATSASITGGGNAKNNGTYNTGIGYKISTDPSYTFLAASPSSLSGNSETSFSKSLTGLTASTQYDVVSALFDQSTGDNVVQSAKVSFTTSAPGIPTVTGSDIDVGVTTTAAGNSNNTITDDGGSSITDKGVCWNTTGTPTTADDNYSAGNGDGNWSGSITGLTAGTTYYLRSYAENSSGTGYSDDGSDDGSGGHHIIFKTKCDAPVVAAEEDVDVTSFTAKWASSVGGQNYKLDASEDSDFSTHLSGYPMTLGDVTSHSVGGVDDDDPLTGDKDYYYRVAATNDGGADASESTISDYSGTESVHTLVAAPGIQATDLDWSTSGDGNDMILTWTNGDGAGRIVVMKDGEGAGVSDPVDGQTYTANNAFGSGTEIGTGTFVVYNATNAKATSSVTVTGLTSQHVYNFKVAEYNGSNSSINYNTSESSDNKYSSGLPVSLLSFRASAIDDNVLISWETASEMNNDYFIIERSLDGEKFDEIASIEGSGNSNILLSYEFVDKQKLNGVVYYRLTQFDYDGKSTVFNMISINLDNIDKTIETVFVDNKSLSIDLNISTKASVSLVDANGKVSQMAILPSEGGRNVKFDMNTLSKGVYFIIVDDGANISSRKFVY